jgi:carbonic anhydrase/acetyltransferase-like protein (isoleucine patch superfamily)
MTFQLENRVPELRGQEHYIAPNAIVIGSVILEDRTSVWFNTVLRGDNDVIRVGEGSNIQDGSVLHTDEGIGLTIGAGVTVGHMAMLHGCTIGANSLIGIKATLLNGATIGKNCIVGAHALVTEGKSIPDNSLVVGSPAKVVRPVSDEEAAALSGLAEHYVANMRRYLSAFRSVRVP